MAMIECPECGRDVSSSAAACPECAYPLAAGFSKASRGAQSGPATRPWWKIVLPITVRLAAGVMLLAGGLEEESVAGVIGAVLVGGSAIPAWYRDKIERLKAGRPAAVLVEGIEDRIAEMEHRFREQMAQLEQVHSGRTAELEERIDFTERLLTKQREEIGRG